MRQINFLQHIGKAHCLICHKDVDAKELANHHATVHTFADQATACTERCGQWFGFTPDISAIRKPEIKKGEAWRKGYSAGFDEAMKACGNCKECYGKGYATTIQFASGRGEFDMGNGDVEISEKLPIMRFCTCGRGKQLKELIKSEYEK